MANETKQSQPGGTDAGASRVRLYILVPLILVLLPMLIEFGCLLNANVGLKQEAARVAEMAAAGAAPAVIEDELSRCRGAVDGRSVECHLLRKPGGDGGAWRGLGLDAGGNDAARGDCVRVRLAYDHPLVLGGLLAPVFGASQGNSVRLEAVAEVVRK